MASSAQCPRCKREHSIEEYEKDRFCKECGTLLKLVNYQTVTSKKRWKDLFPYDPYPPQIDFIKDIEETVVKGKVLIAEACNGFGKTIASLSCLLTYKRPIIYATRTHEQVRQVLLELETINKRARTRYTAVNLASRSHLCINPDCRALPANEAQELCHALRRSDECPYIHDLEKLPKGLPPILSREVLLEQGRRRNICPYFMSRRASKEAKVVVAPYPYVFNPMIRKATGFELNGKFLIFDEGHNVDKVGQETLSDTLTERGLSAATEELKQIKRSSRLVRNLGEFLLKTDTGKPKLVTGRRLEHDIEEALGIDIDTFITGYAQLVDEIRTSKLKKGMPPVSSLNGLLGFLELLQTSQKEKYVGVYKRNYFGAPVIEYRCLDPSLAVKPIIDEAYGVLIMSGTLSPLDIFSEIIGLPSAIKKAYPPIQKSKKIKMVIDKNVTTVYRERTDKMIKKIGQGVSAELEKIDQGALIFFTQRGFMNQCIDKWAKQGILTTKNGRMYLGGKQLYREGRDARQNRDIVVRYKRMAKSIGGAVLCCVFRGRNSEGSNFPGDEARAIFLIGVPYANYGDPLVKAQIAYFDKTRRGLGNRWYTMDAFRAANQSLGRGIRGKDDWCHYWMFDRRYAEQRNLISKWAMGEGPEIRRKTNISQQVIEI